MSTKETPITSSFGFYCFACTILTGMSAGITNVFWIYLLLTFAFGSTAMYQIYRSAKANNENSVTYYFFAADYLGFGLLMVTFYLDYHMRFINMDHKNIVQMLLLVGVFCIIGAIKKRFKK